MGRRWHKTWLFFEGRTVRSKAQCEKRRSKRTPFLGVRGRCLGNGSSFLLRWGLQLEKQEGRGSLGHQYPHCLFAKISCTSFFLGQNVYSYCYHITHLWELYNILKTQSLPNVTQFRKILLTCSLSPLPDKHFNFGSELL